MDSMKGTLLPGDAPNEVRAGAPGGGRCAVLRGVERRQDGTTLPPPRRDEAGGLVYSCPVLLDALEGDLFLGFDTLTDLCSRRARLRGGRPALSSPSSSDRKALPSWCLQQVDQVRPSWPTASAACDTFPLWRESRP